MPNNEFMKQIFRAQDESNQDPKLFKELVMKYTGLTPRGFKNEMSGPVGKTTLLKGKPARDYYIKSDSKLSESEILFLKKYAGLLTEEEEIKMKMSATKSVNQSSQLQEGIQFTIPISGEEDAIKRSGAYGLSNEFKRLLREQGKELYNKIIEDYGRAVNVITDDWSSAGPDGNTNAINFYLYKKLDESDRKTLIDLLNRMEDRAMELGFKLGKFRYITSPASHEDPSYTGGKVDKTKNEGLSAVRVINIPIVDFPESKDVPEVDVHHQNAEIIFSIMGENVEKDVNPFTGSGNIVMGHGKIDNKDIPKYIQKLVKAKNSNNLSSYTVSSHKEPDRTTVDRSGDVPNINRVKGNYYGGTDESRIRELIDRMIELFRYAQEHNEDITWS